MQRVLQVIRPRLYVEEPYNPFRRWLFRLVTHKYFDATIMGFIVANTLFMALEHEGQSQSYVLECGVALDVPCRDVVRIVGSIHTGDDVADVCRADLTAHHIAATPACVCPTLG